MSPPPAETQRDVSADKRHSLPHKQTPPPPPAQPAQKRDLLEMIARAVDDDDAVSGATLLTTLKGIFNDAKKLDKVATTTGILSDGANIIGSV